MKNNPTLYNWIWGILIIGISSVYCHSGHFSFVSENESSIIIYGLITPFLLSYFKRKETELFKQDKLTSLVLAFLFSSFISIGKNYYYKFDWTYCFGGARTLLFLLFQITIYTIVIYRIIVGLFSQIKYYSMSKEDNSISFRKWFWYIIFIKLIYFIFFFPCLFDFDAALGLRTFLDPNSAICNHHPVFVEAIHALFFTLGSWIGSKTIGMALLSILFIISSTWVIIYGLLLFQKAGASKKALVYVAALFMFFPFFPYVSLLPTKDGFFAYVFLLYVFSLFHIYISDTYCLKNYKFLFIHCISAILVCMTRHQGLYLVTICSAALLFAFRKHWLIILKASAINIFVPLFTNMILFPMWNVEPGGKQEIYGTLFQQTACYLCYYPQDITKEEKKNILTIIDENTIMHKYEFHITDPVKNEYKYNPRYSEYNGGPRKFQHIDHSQEKEELNNYLSTWVSMGKRHPLIYLQASATIFLGYFYNTGTILLDIYNDGFYHSKANTPNYQYWRINIFSRLFKDVQSQIKAIPIISLFVAIPYYIWASILLLAVIVSRKDIKAIAVTLPILISIGVLLICPVVTGRYVFPIVICLPALVLFVLISNKNNICFPTNVK